SDASVLYFGANKGGMYAVNARDGSLKWKFPIYGSIYSSPALDAQGKLYTGSTSEVVYGVDASTGAEFAEYAAKAGGWTAPSIRPDGTVVVGTRDSRILALG